MPEQDGPHRIEPDMHTTIGKLTEGQTVTAIQGRAVQGPAHVVTRVINVTHGKVHATRVDFAFGGVVPFFPSNTACTVAQ